MYYVIQIKKLHTNGHHYVYGPYSEEEAKYWKSEREKIYADRYQILIVESITL